MYHDFEKSVVGFLWKLSPMQMLTLLQRDGGESWVCRSQKTHGLVQRLIGKAKAAQTNEEKQRGYSLLPLSKQEFRHPQKSGAASHRTLTFEKQIPSLPASPLPSSPAFVAEQGLGYSLALLRSDLLTLCLQTPCASPAHSLVGAKRQKRP